jgi:sugar transferase (PEP-CTERM/EpsH1 system associated)
VKVLLLTHRIPYPPDKGDKIRSYHLVASLARHHEIDLVTHIDDPQDLEHVAALDSLCQSVSAFVLRPWQQRMRAAAALCRKSPLSVAWMTCRGARERVRALIDERRPELVVGYSAQVAAYLPTQLACPVVLDFVDVDSQKWATYGKQKGLMGGWVDRLEARRLADFERRAAARADRIVLTTRREADLFLARIGKFPVEVITNGVDLPDEMAPAGARDPALMVFVGTMDYAANVQAAEIGAREVLPMVRKEFPEARFRIVGRNPAARVRRLASLPGVEVTGRVDDPGRHLGEAALALFPLRVVRGIQNKVLEAMARGVPVVAPPDVSRCLGTQGRDVILGGDAPGALATASRDLLRDPLERDRAARAGREFVARHHDWSRIEREWERLLEDVTGVCGPVGERS